MGVLSYFNLQDYINKFNISTLIETGSGTGNGIRYAQKFSFKNIYSCEIDTQQALKLANELISDLRVSILRAKSSDFLNYLFDLEHIKNEKSLIFFLDAHFPSADLGKAKYEDEKNLDIRLPLEIELDIIYNKRNPRDYKDVILIDDWRIYKKMNFRGGDLEAINLGHLAKYGTTFIDKWNETHYINIIESDTGYAVLEPKI